ncbi:AraC family transcriptional regulator [Spirosoma sordidisoli]|uniref:AraC family transcriptional regulator n=1 Tax=Spirosoma sordidisoli TaxID=2502893 RepID=A0A4Q2ULV7_9BACT|nr:AraC family transcriptional regulator [Spirosoma sordidisoli]RYC69722.1 AraC family transcriptional regulator [Spirosoma sordidisoli]
MDALLTLKLRLLHCGYTQLGAEWQFDGVISPFSRLYLVTDGEAWVWHHQQKFTLRPGWLYLIPSFSLSRYHCDSRMTQFYVSMLEETENGLSVFDVLPFGYEMPALEIDQRVFERLLALNPARSLQNIDPKVYDNQPNLLSFNQSGPGQSAGQLLETQGILLQLLSRFVGLQSDDLSQQAGARIQLRSVLNYIHTHLAEKINVEQLAALQHLNTDYFSRQFQKLLGIRPIDYIINKRLERAQLLMMTSSLTLQAIAEQVGIADIYYFSRLFKRRFGVSPGQFRKQGRQI